MNVRVKTAINSYHFFVATNSLPLKAIKRRQVLPEILDPLDPVQGFISRLFVKFSKDEDVLKPIHTIYKIHFPDGCLSDQKNQFDEFLDQHTIDSTFNKHFHNNEVEITKRNRCKNILAKPNKSS